MTKRTSIILVIDDDSITRLTLGTLLEGSGYHVEMAENGPEGLAKAKKILPDVILLDVMMPGMDGYEVCRHLRADSKLAEVPIFMITALDDRNSRLAGLSAGADDFLTKPYDSLELEIRLNMLKRVDRYRTLQEEREKLKTAMSQLKQKNAQLRQLSRQVLQAHEDERQTLAREMHDEIGQIITGLRLILEQHNEDPAQRLEKARQIANELLQRVREISLDLHPTALDEFGLSAALDGLLKRFTSKTGIVVHHNIDPKGESRFDKAIEAVLFRVAQEALENIARHAKVNEANVMLVSNAEYLQLSISDSGQGFDPSTLKTGASKGISGMAKQVELVGGEFILQSIPGEGTLIRAYFDLQNPG